MWSILAPLGVKRTTDNDVIEHLLVADSESSSVRSVSLVDGAVKAVVGAERDPTVRRTVLL